MLDIKKISILVTLTNMCQDCMILYGVVELETLEVPFEGPFCCDRSRAIKLEFGREMMYLL